jgi:type I restriction enzyme M protein
LANSQNSRVLDNAELGYRRIRVERPLRLRSHASPVRVKCLQEHPTFIALSSDLAGEQMKCVVVAALQGLPQHPSYDQNEYLSWLDKVLKPFKPAPSLSRWDARPMLNERGQPLPD